MTDRILTASDACAITALVDASAQQKPVARVINEDTGDAFYGIARHMASDADGNFYTDARDIRDQYMRVTLKNGFEAYWPINELVNEIKRGMFVVDYRS